MHECKPPCSRSGSRSNDSKWKTLHRRNTRYQRPSVTSKDIRDGIGISFNPRFHAVGRDSIYGVIRIYAETPRSSPMERAFSFVKRTHTARRANTTQALLYSSTFHVFPHIQMVASGKEEMEFQTLSPASVMVVLLSLLFLSLSLTVFLFSYCYLQRLLLVIIS